ncbi:MAG: hypothetical protein O3C40_29945 [Planctomycetota bacterium]|nr:hypothetical protein [Planctomycetota bacterium]
MAKKKQPTVKRTRPKSAVKKKKKTRSTSSSHDAKPSDTTAVELDVARDRRTASECAIVGLGASAGGLDAFKRFFTEMPPDSGMAFVLIQHLDPTHESLTGDLLAKYTTMNVEQVEDRMPVEANHVYVIPPNRYLAVRRGELHLTAPIERRGMRMPIDFFFQSLAEDQEERAIGIILSGTGTDGTMGMKTIKAHVGMMMVQEPSTAQYDGMPRSAMATGMADYILPIEEMPESLIKYVNHPYITQAGEATLAQRDPDHLNMILALLRARTSYDFHCYKQTTLTRRIQRRMGLSNVNQPADYVKFLRENPPEVTRLFKDLLIGVTSFFREPEAWQVLETKVLPDVVRRRSHQTLDASRTGPNSGEFGYAGENDSPVRVWLPGCATGEEAYSMAMLLSEQVEAAGGAGMRIFATDINDDGLDVARSGVYPDSIAADVSPERLRKFFSKAGSTYRVNKSLRESVTFAVQNLISDPHFSKLDLICCRNLLIYLEAPVHKKVLSLFHFALNDGGYLFLGNSETIGTQDDLFEIVSKKWRIYRRIGSSHPVGFPIVAGHERSRQAAVEGELRRPARLGQLAQNILLGEYAPPLGVDHGQV